MLYSEIKKLHVSAGSCHHQVLSFDSLKIILYNSRGGVFDEETSTSKHLLEHSTSIMGVWVNLVTILKSTTPEYQKQKTKRPKREDGSDMQLSLAPTKILQAASPGRETHVFVFVFDNIGLYFYVLLRGSHTHTQYRGTMLQQGF